MEARPGVWACCACQSSMGRHGLSQVPEEGLDVAKAFVPWVAPSRLLQRPVSRGLIHTRPHHPQARSCGCLQPRDSRVAHPCFVSAHLSLHLSQRIQESCQSGTRWLVETQVKARRRRGPQKGSSPPAHSLSQKGSRLPGTVPAYLSLGPWEDCHRPSAHGGPRAYPGRRFRRDAALRSPYSSTEPLCSPR